MDEELLSVLINLKNAEPDKEHETSNPTGLSTKATDTDGERVQG